MSEAQALLITGATGPMAEASVRLLSERGDRLLLTGRNTARLEELEKSYDVETLTVDVTKPLGARHAAEVAKDRLGRLDGLVHLVGSFQMGSVERTTATEYEWLLSANFLSAVRTTQAVLSQLDGGGRLVYVGSVLASEPLPGFGAYAASKAALLAWVRALSHEVKHRGIHANAVMMTMADTPDARRTRPHVDFSQAVTPEVVARTIGFLTSEAADGLYGSIVPVLGRTGGSPPHASPPSGSGPSGSPPLASPPPGRG